MCNLTVRHIAMRATVKADGRGCTRHRTLQTTNCKRHHYGRRVCINTANIPRNHSFESVLTTEALRLLEWHIGSQGIKVLWQHSV